MRAIIYYSVLCLLIATIFMTTFIMGYRLGISVFRDFVPKYEMVS